MSQTPSIEEIMQRIRLRVSQRSAGIQTASGEQFEPQGRPQPAASLAHSVPSRHFELEANDFSPLRGEIDTALEGTRRVGQINPRNPGLHNYAIQFVKKAMRRSLTWYTRPLHYFQGGAIRALERITGILQSHDQSLQSISHELTRHVGLIEQNAEEISTQRTALADDMSALKVSLVDDISAVKDNISALELSASAHERKTEALEEKASALLQQTASLQVSILALTEKAAGLDQRLRQANFDVEAKLARWDAAEKEKFEEALMPCSLRIASITDEIGLLRSELQTATREGRELRLKGHVRDRDLRRLYRDFRSGTLAPSEQQSAAPVPSMFPSGIKSESQFDYFVFEELYRGDEADIRIRQKKYLEYFRGCESVIDIGCGRGEFLELLRDNKITAKGVELGTDQYLLCMEKGLDVVQQDLFSYLESLPDESLGGLFSAQVIEHFTASDQLRYVTLAYRKTKPGSPVVFETINAQCVWAVLRNFFLDPTHVRPVHPETLKFAMESVGFKDVELRFSNPMADRLVPPLQLNEDTAQLAKFNRAIQDLNELLYGNQDYAAIGWR